MKSEMYDKQDSEMIKNFLELLSPQYKQLDDLTSWLKKLTAYSRDQYNHTLDDLLSETSTTPDEIYLAWDSEKDPIMFLDDLMADEFGEQRKRAGIGNFGKSRGPNPNTTNINNPFG